MGKKGRKIRIYEKCFKRLFDVVFSFLALVILSPILLVVAILVRIKLGSPVIFKQERPGKNEKIFKLYKFRTMTDKRDKNGKLLPDEKRLTKFGRRLRSTSLDELPELFNILKGDMSFVGPRPLLIKYLPFYSKEEMRRHSVRPGLTGLAQINGRNDLNWSDRFKKDLEYVDHIKFTTDFKILFMTASKVLKSENVRMGDNMRMQDLDKEREGNENKTRVIDCQFYKAHKAEIKSLISELARDDSDLKRIMKNMGVFLKNGSASVLCYVDGGVVKGVLWSFYIKKDRLHINYFVVDGSCRGSGVGTTLIERAISGIKDNCIVELLVDNDNKAAVAFYEKRGFANDMDYDDNPEKRRMVLIKKRNRTK